MGETASMTMCHMFQVETQAHDLIHILRHQELQNRIRHL